jgi:hypothetical protein
VGLYADMCHQSMGSHEVDMAVNRSYFPVPQPTLFLCAQAAGQSSIHLDVSLMYSVALAIERLIPSTKWMSLSSRCALADSGLLLAL